MQRIQRAVSTGIGLLTFLAVGVAWAQQPSTNDTGTQPSNTQPSTRDTGTQPGAQQPSTGAQRQQPMPSSTVGEVISATATVQSVDMKKRDVQLKDAEGNEFTLNVPEDVTRLDNIKKGDKVTVTYKQSLALALKKGGSLTPSETQMAARKAGNLPGGMMGRQITASVKVVKVDPEANKLTVKMNDGKTDTINVSDPQLQSQMKDIKPGDRIQASYTEAVAMSVTPKNKEMP